MKDLSIKKNKDAEIIIAKNVSFRGNIANDSESIHVNFTKVLTLLDSSKRSVTSDISYSTDLPVINQGPLAGKIEPTDEEKERQTKLKEIGEKAITGIKSVITEFISAHEKLNS